MNLRIVPQLSVGLRGVRKGSRCRTGGGGGPQVAQSRCSIRAPDATLEPSLTLAGSPRALASDTRAMRCAGVQDGERVSCDTATTIPDRHLWAMRESRGAAIMGRFTRASSHDTARADHAGRLPPLVRNTIGASGARGGVLSSGARSCDSSASFQSRSPRRLPAGRQQARRLRVRPALGFGVLPGMPLRSWLCSPLVCGRDRHRPDVLRRPARRSPDGPPKL